MGPLALRSTPAHAAQASIVAVEWGGPYIEIMTKLTEEQSDIAVSWEQHAGGSAGILAKIKAGWPHPRYDVVASYDPVYAAFIREKWYEPLSLDDIPTLKDVPDVFLVKDTNGKIVNVPRSVSGYFFGYRADTVPFEIKTLDDLLDPRLKGQICWNDPISGSGVWLLPLALHGGGDDHNLEPGWEFTKKLAQSGNIGRVAQSEADFINSISTKETSVAFWDAGGWMGVAKNFQQCF
jgi:putative spermidine/putrescine transport system substrate-binding protein